MVSPVLLMEYILFLQRVSVCTWAGLNGREGPAAVKDTQATNLEYRARAQEVAMRQPVTGLRTSCFWRVVSLSIASYLADTLARQNVRTEAAWGIQSR